MVFERKIKSKGKEYWILAHSIRKNGRIIQKSKYLGKELPSKKRLEQLKKEFIREMGGKKYKYFSEKEISEIEDKKDKYKKELKKLSSLEKKKALEEFAIRFTYDSSKLAGVDVTLRQTFLILKDGIIPKNFKNLKTVKELENHEKGFAAITKYKGSLNMGFIKKLHKILFLGIDDAVSGKLRSELRRNVNIAGTIYIPPKWNEINKQLKSLFEWRKAENRKMHPLELAALVHLKLVSLQPFVDGNSRLSRLLMNWVLWKKNYPLIDIPANDLENYYNVLDKYQIEKDEKPFIQYIKQKYLGG